MTHGANETPAGLPRILILIITWNRVDEVVRCLESFSRLEYPNYETLIVDDASQDATVSVVRERYPWVRVVVNERNLGYAGASNVGFRLALESSADHVFLLNQDTELTETVLHELVRVLESDPRIAIAGAKNLLMDNPKYTWGKYGVINWGPVLVRTEGRSELDRPVASPRDVDFVIGNGCLMRCRALQEVGLFDERFFQMHEDVDWSYRARQMGYRAVYVDEAAIHHKGSSSSAPASRILFGSKYFVSRNSLFFARKHANPWQWARLLVLMSVGIVLRIAIEVAYATFCAFRNQVPFVAGMVDGARDVDTRRPEARRAADGPPIPLNTPIDRLARWLGG
jgi:GT2 family glycosyltransferase